MLTLSAAGSVVLGAVVALVLAAGLIALYIGLRMRRDATHDRAVAARLEVLQATSPAAPMIVRADGRVECPQQLEDWLGLAMPPATLRDLSEGEHGLDSGSAQALNDAVRGAQRAARPFRVVCSSTTKWCRSIPSTVARLWQRRQAMWR